MYLVETRWKVTSSQGHRVAEFSESKFGVLGLQAGKHSRISHILSTKKDMKPSASAESEVAEGLLT